MFGFSPVSRVVKSFGLLLGAGAVLLAGGFAAAQGYKQPRIVPTGNWPAFVTTNFASEGTQQNLIYIDPGATPAASVTHVLLNDGKGNFKLAQTLATGGSVLAAGDFDGDKTDDLGWVTCTTVCSAYYAPGRGDGTYGTPVLLGTLAPGAHLPVAAYLSAAGMHRNVLRADLVVADAANSQIYVLSVDTKGASVSGTPVTGGVGQIDLEIADYNGDGNADLIFPGAVSGLETMLPGNGDGTFGTPVVFPQMGQVLHSRVLPGGTELNAPLQINCEGPNGRIDVWEIERDGTVGTRPIATTGSRDARSGTGGQVVVRLVNGSESYLYATNPLGMSVLQAGPDGSYTLQAVYNVGPRRGAAVPGFFDGTGGFDFALDSPEGIAIVPVNDDGTLQTSLSFAAGQPAYSMALGKFTDSGALDAVVATGTPQVQWMRGDGRGNFAAEGGPSPAVAAQTNAGRSVWSHVVAGDFNRDGKLDVVTMLDGPLSVDLGPCCAYPATADGLLVQYGHGDGSFDAPEPDRPTANDPKYGEVAEAQLSVVGQDALLTADLGRLITYLATSDDFASIGSDHVFSTGSNSTQHPYQQFALGQLTQGRVPWSDFVAQFPTSSGSNFLTVANSGGDGFNTQQISLTVPPGYVAPSLATSLLPSTGMYVSAMALQDLDGDGFGDLEVLYHNLAADPANPSPLTQNQLYIYWGNGVGASGNGTFEPTPEILTLSRNFYQMAVADVDGDGKQDLVLSDGYVVSVLAGNGTRVGFGRETHYLAGSGINQLAVVDVNGDGKLDIVTANGGAVLSHGVVNNGVLAVNAEVNTGGVTVLASDGQSAATGSVTGTVTATPNPAPFGSSVQFTATLSGAGPTPTGTVTLFAGTLQIGVQTLSGGSGSYTDTGTPILNAGSYVLTAVYSGDGNYAATTITGAAPLVVNPVPTTTTLIDIVSPIFYGQIIADNGMEIVSPDPDGGTLDFLINGAVACSLLFPIPPNPNRCGAATGAGYDAGTYKVQSVYSGDQNFLGSSSDVQTVVVNPDPTSAALTSSANPSTVGQAVTFTATITDVYHVAAGTVNFFDGGTMIGTGTVNGQGIATFTTSALAVSPPAHAITACLVASLDFLASNPCGAVSQTVNPVVIPPPPPPPPPGSFTLVVNPTAISVGVGNVVSVQVTVAELNGYSQPVQLGCSGLPHETTCTFAQSLIRAGGGTTAMLVSPAAPHNCGSSAPDFIAPNLKAGLAGLALGGLGLFSLRRRRKLLKAVGLMLALGVVPMLGGCGGGCKDFGTEPTNYSFTVTATSTGSPATAQTQVVTLKVHL